MKAGQEGGRKAVSHACTQAGKEKRKTFRETMKEMK